MAKMVITSASNAHISHSGLTSAVCWAVRSVAACARTVLGPPGVDADLMKALPNLGAIVHQGAGTTPPDQRSVLRPEADRQRTILASSHRRGANTASLRDD
jgi:hypothetical protein